MAKVTGMKTAFRQLEKNVVRVIQTKGRDLVATQLMKSLDRQIDAYGKKMPKKAESTIKGYKKKGLDTKHWFIRTGTSVTLRFTKTPTGIIIYPYDPAKALRDYVGFNRSDGKGLAQDWFAVTEKTENQILKKLGDYSNG